MTVTQLAEPLFYISFHSIAITNDPNQLCFADLQNLKSLCSQGQQAIELLGEFVVN